MTDHQQVREALEPCPFCGGTDLEIDDETPLMIGVFCNTCECQTGPMGDRREAIAAWNRRAPRLEAAAVPELSREDVVRLAEEASQYANAEYPRRRFAREDVTWWQLRDERFAALARSVPVGEVKPVAWCDERAIQWLADHPRAAGITTKLTASKSIGRPTPLYTTQPAPPEGWRPIETAPKGAKGYSWMLLSWGPEDDPSTGYGMRVGNQFYAAATFYCLGHERHYQMREIEVNPTHWMPLPAAPQPGDKA